MKFTPTPEQADICKQYQSSIIPYSGDDMIAVALDSIGKQPIYGTRIHPEPGERISWFFHCGKHSDSVDFYQPIHIQHLKDLIPDIEKYLCLDYGYKIIITPNGHEDVWREDYS